MKQRSDLFWATVGEAGLVLVISMIAWAAKQPLIFASLGPTAYELSQQPKLPSARTYNVLVGHLVGIGAAFLALYLVHGWSAPHVASAHIVVPARIYAATIAAGLTTFTTLLIKANQPAANATTLLISLGGMQTRQDAVAIIVGVVLITAIGEPLRHFRLKQRDAQEAGAA